MASSTMPQEIITWHLLPAIRRDLAVAMVKNGMSQRQAARKLGLTDAAVSQYKSGKRAGGLKLGPTVGSMINKSAKSISSGADVMSEINIICDYCRDKLVLCRVHKAHGAPRKCDLCFRVAKRQAR